MRQLTVHPLLSRLVLDELDNRRIVSPAGLLARRRLDAGHRLTVASQTTLLSELGRHVGPSGLLDMSKGISFATAGLAQQVLLATLNSSTLFSALTRLTSLGAHLHPTHRINLQQQTDGVLARHHAVRGPTPTAEETIFVFGIHLMVARLYGSDGLRGELIDRQGHPLNNTNLEKLQCSDLNLSGWRLTWVANNIRSPIASLDHALLSSVQGINVRPPTLSHTLAGIVTRLVESDLQCRWTVKAIAHEVGMSSRSLQRAINAEGTSVRTLIHDARLSAAVHHLASSDLQLDDIAWLCGYASASHLGNTVRKSHQTTPSQLRG